MIRLLRGPSSGLASLLLLCAITIASGDADAEQPGIGATTRFTPVSARALTTPQPVKASDGNYHLAYELVLTNPTGAEVSVETVEVRDAADGRVILSLTGADLSGQMNPIGDITPTAAGNRIARSAASIIWLDRVAPGRGGIPRKIDHRVVGSIATPAGGRSFDAAVLPLVVNLEDPVVLAPPVAGGTWLMSEGCCRNFTHHRRGLAPIDGELYVPQRFAIDFFRLDDQHRSFVGDPTKLESYLSYGLPVLAAADGLVVAAFDGLPDQHPPKPPAIRPIQDTVGNHVIVQVRPTIYLLYAHMKPGSVAVAVGQRLKVGDRIGLIGTTGNSTTPHLHFQTLTTPTFFPADSTPYVFDGFTVVGHETERIWDDDLGLRPDGTLPFAPAADPERLGNAMPLDRDVVTFPGR